MLGSFVVGHSWFLLGVLGILVCLQHLEPGTEPFTFEQEFGAMILSDYESDEDADSEPSDSESSADELEYNSGACKDELEEEISGGDAET